MESIKSQICGQVASKAGDQVWSITGTLENQIAIQVLKPVMEQTWDNVCREIWNQITENINEVNKKRNV
jgi:hypothetical protein